MLQDAAERANVDCFGLHDDLTGSADLKTESISGGNAEVLTNFFRNGDLALGSDRRGGHVLTRITFPCVIPYCYFVRAICAGPPRLLPNITTTDFPVAGPRVEPSMTAMPQSS